MVMGGKKVSLFGLESGVRARDFVKTRTTGRKTEEERHRENNKGALYVCVYNGGVQLYVCTLCMHPRQ